MKNNELRIGNWVTNSNGDVFQIEIGAFYLYHQNKEWGVLPITLTEEWLLKFGFESSDQEINYMEWTHKEKHWFSLGNDGGLHDWENQPFYFRQDGYWDVKTPLTHVHQLQNLYFALTGEELILK